MRERGKIKRKEKAYGLSAQRKPREVVVLLAWREERRAWRMKAA
jgi:hypothetical protein